jgi:hypothetical protein
LLEKLNKKSIKYKLRKRTLGYLKKTLGLKGYGTKDSPIVIDDLGDVTVEISIVTKGIYLILKNLAISKLSIADSQHVVIEECFIVDLELVECRNLTLRSNTILRIEQFLCRNCVYENNSILGKEYAKLTKNTREKRKFICIWIFLGVGILHTVLAVNSMVYISLSFASIVYLIMGGSLSIGMTYLLKLRYQINKFPQNTYLNFIIQEKAAFLKPLIKIV